MKLPEDVIGEIDVLRRQIAGNYVPGSWEGIDKLHLTMKFLGDTDEEKTGEIINVLEQIATKYSRIYCKTGRFGFFLPRILYLGLEADRHLRQLAEELNFSFEKLGFQRENRNFKAHITLLRIKKDVSDGFVSDFNNYSLPAREFYLNELSLMKSWLLPGGSVYTEIKSINLI